MAQQSLASIEGNWSDIPGDCRKFSTLTRDRWFVPGIDTMAVSDIRPDNEGGLESISIVLNGKMRVVFSQITKSSMHTSFANASGQMYSFKLYRCDGGAAPATEGRTVPVQNPPRSQETAIIQALAMQMTRRLEQEYWRTGAATLPPGDVAMLCVTRAHQIYPLGDPRFAPDQAIRLRIDVMRRCFVAQGYQEQ
ncbi:hypothetical protein [Microvirga arsenatis]|uniref:Uncharacterized protein n=1 Tax=Microvirga arsenatis TaxID=2692265 RepID=A0ABW9YXB8_9HYPH|nr:hypothetical protein [Microvirga arsenatis]NBJ10943.1 hypothetical protein [Microvirga arsenatis]NBJ24160.1 hypothetical protein [Microvirga arsenatis]